MGLGRKTPGEDSGDVRSQEVAPAPSLDALLGAGHGGSLELPAGHFATQPWGVTVMGGIRWP